MDGKTIIALEKSKTKLPKAYDAAYIHCISFAVYQLKAYFLFDGQCLKK